MRVCAAEFPDEPSKYESAIEYLTAHVREALPDLLVLPEMPFTPWIFYVEKSDPEQWVATVEDHSKWLSRLASAVATPAIFPIPTVLAKAVAVA